jgi:TRAP-type C4-dicarboxylate transport system permease large subunit
MSTQPHPEDYPTAWSYFHAGRLWRKRTGGSLIVNVAVAAIAGGITGSQLAVVVFIALAVVVTLARRGQP